MNSRLKRAIVGASTCAVVALVATLSIGGTDEPLGARLVVPQAQDSDSGSDIPKPPPTSVSVILPAPPVSTTSTAPAPPPATSAQRQPLVPAPRPMPAAPVDVDFQAEDARIYKGSVQSNHSGFTGSGFVDYFNETGGAVEWTVTASTAGSTTVVFRFANGSQAPRPVVVVVNRSVAESVTFPVTNGWSDWRTLTVHISLVAGVNKITAIATSGNGGPNFDKITVPLPPRQ